MLTDRDRERAAFRYIGALERGDFDAVAALLRNAERDPDLARMLAEIDRVYTAELDRPLNNSRLREEETMTAFSMPIYPERPERMAQSGLLLFAALIALTFAALLVVRAMIMNSAPPSMNLSGGFMSESPSALPQNDTGDQVSLCYQVTESVPLLRAGAGRPDMLTPEMVFRIQSAQLINGRTWLYVIVGETGVPEGWIEADSATFRIQICDFSGVASVVALTPTVVEPSSAQGGIVLPNVVVPSINVPSIMVPAVPTTVPSATETPTPVLMQALTPIPSTASAASPTPALSPAAAGG